MNRRSFLKRTAAALAGILACPMALGRGRATPRKETRETVFFEVEYLYRYDAGKFAYYMAAGDIIKTTCRDGRIVKRERIAA